MNTTTNNTTTTEVNAVQLLVKFANQRPNLDFNNYGDRTYYMQDYREILKDLHSFHDLLNLASRRIDNLNEVLFNALLNSSDRLSINEINGTFKLQYITGQYFPTEYRNASCRVLARIIWNDFMNERHANGELVYNTGHQIRKAINSNFSSRNTKSYFN